MSDIKSYSDTMEKILFYFIEKENFGQHTLQESFFLYQHEETQIPYSQKISTFELYIIL